MFVLELPALCVLQNTSHCYLRTWESSRLQQCRMSSYSFMFEMAEAFNASL